MKEEYKFRQIEEKWQRVWEEKETFRATEDDKKNKYYCLEMYPYPSGRIHMGHVRNFSIVDVISRFKIMRGFNVLHPIGWDAFGMPAENAAIEQGIHPQKWTLDNIAHMKTQLKRLGFSYDWPREVTTCLPEYYTWNQWIFLKLFEKGLAYRKKSLVNWCPDCQTVLANEQVITGKCWRCDAVAVYKDMEQWFLKITEYAEELLTGHTLLEKWPGHVLTMQRNWIGKSTGAHITFPLVDSSRSIEVFTTRIDTIYGATFMVLSPEHPLSKELIKDSHEKENLEAWIDKNITEIKQKGPGEIEREGIDTGKKAINPFTHQEIPVWIANYVLMEYGTGAIMAVPAHDQRDFEFAQKYNLQIKEVIVSVRKEEEESEALFEGYGVLINSGEFSARNSKEAMVEMAQYAEEKGFGKASTLFRLRDWGVSRQRYWGTPIPVVYCQSCGIVGVPYQDLPVSLPVDVEFKGEEGSPLEKSEGFVKTECPQCKGEARRETDTMDTFFDSSWYYFRYCSPDEGKLPFGREPAKYWMPVDIYVGGVEHAILHLIYARFFCKALRDLGLTSVDEPFPYYLAQGMVTKDGAVMSKSKGNVVDPDEIATKFGVDTTRLFILFASPPEKEFAWNEKGIEGSYRFLNRLWLFFQENEGLFREEMVPGTAPLVQQENESPLRMKMHQTIKKVTEDIEKRFHLNTAISASMELFNMIRKDHGDLISSSAGKALLKEALEALLLLLSPFAPHLCEELWQRTGHNTLISKGPWPDFDPELAKEDTVTIVVQVNGKVRDKFDVERGLPDDQVRQAALDLERIRNILSGKEPKKVIYIENKLINIVV